MTSNSWRRYTFPLNWEDYSQVNSMRQMSNMLRQEWNSQHRPEKNYIFIVRANQSYIYAKCRLCSSILKFKMNEQTGFFKVYTFENEHHHCSIERSQGRVRGRMMQVRKIMSDLPSTHRKHQIMRQISDRLRIKPTNAYYLLKNYWRQEEIKQSFQDMIRQLSFSADNFKCYYDTKLQFEDQYPDPLIIISDTMKQLYGGKVGPVYLSVSIGVVIRSTEEWYCIIVYGASETMKLDTLYAVAYTKKYDQENADYIYKKIFQVLGEGPDMIVTDCNAITKKAIKHLGKQQQIKPKHIISSYAIITQTKAQIQPSFTSEVIEHLKAIIYARDDEQFNEEMNLLLKKAHTWKQQDIRGLKYFYDEKQRCCLSKINRDKYVGLAFSERSIANKLHDVLQSQGVKSNTIDSSLQMVLKTFQMRDEKTVADTTTLEKKAIKKIEQSKQVELALKPEMRYKQMMGFTCTDVQSQITQNILQTVWLTIGDVKFSSQMNDFDHMQSLIVNNGERCSRKVYRQQKQSKQTKQVVEIKDNLVLKKTQTIWRCQCGYFGRVGIPCQHQLKACLIYNTSLLSQISENWMLYINV